MNRRSFMAFSASLLAALNSQGVKAYTAEKIGNTRMSGMDELARMDALGQASLVKSKEVSPYELVSAAIDRIEKLDGVLNSVVYRNFERALEAAKSYKGTGVFSGVPYVIKGYIEYEGLPATKSSRFFSQAVAHTQSPYVDALDNSGAIVVGLSNMPELAMLPSTEPLLYGATKNPWDLTRSTAGSSGGTAAAVAAGLVPIGAASDGGGSIRMPASHCGLFGLKLSRGREIGNGADFIVSMGCLSRTVRDTAAYLAVTENRSPIGMQPVGMITGASKKRLKIAYTTRNHYGAPPSTDVAKATLSAARLLDELGHQVVEERFEVDGEEFMHHFMIFWSLGAAYAVDSIQSIIKTKPDDSMLEPWTLGLAEYHHKNANFLSVESAYRYFRVLRTKFELFLQKYDIYLTPVLMTAPPRLGEMAPTVDFNKLLTRVTSYVSYTPMSNAAGNPSMSVPLYWSAEDLPIGSLITAGYGKEALLLSLAYELEQARPWNNRWAPNSIIAMSESRRAG